MNLVKRVMKVLLDRNSIGRTDLSESANIHYNRLIEQLNWLEGEGYIMLGIKDGKIVVELTPKGREFALTLSAIDN